MVEIRDRQHQDAASGRQSVSKDRDRPLQLSFEGRSARVGVVAEVVGPELEGHVGRLPRPEASGCGDDLCRLTRRVAYLLARRGGVDDLERGSQRFESLAEAV